MAFFIGIAQFVIFVLSFWLLKEDPNHLFHMGDMEGLKKVVTEIGEVNEASS